jgi:hypothetical protein
MNRRQAHIEALKAANAILLTCLDEPENLPLGDLPEPDYALVARHIERIAVSLQMRAHNLACKERIE